MKIPIEVNYRCNTVTRVVIAKFAEKEYPLTDYMENHKSRQVPMIEMNPVKLTDLVGKAVAAPGEEFDMFKGMAIAKARLMKKFYKRCQMAISKEISAMTACQHELLKFESEFGFKALNSGQKADRIAK